MDDLHIDGKELEGFDAIQKDIPSTKWKELTVEVKRKRRRVKLSPIYRDKDGDT